jgi:hypothetical protein
MPSGDASGCESAPVLDDGISPAGTVALRPAQDDGGQELASKAQLRLAPLIAVLAGGGLVAGILLWSFTKGRGTEPQLPTIDLTAAADSAAPRATASPGATIDGGRQARKRAPRARAARRPRQKSTGTAVEHDRKRLASLIADARSRGLFVGDDAAHDRLVTRARAQLDAGQDAAAIKTIETLEERLQGFRIDRSFADRKLKRLGQAVRRAKLDRSQREELERLSQRVLQLIIAGQLVEASRLMSKAFTRLGLMVR